MVVGVLEAEKPSFKHALEALTRGIERRDKNTLFFFEIFRD